MEKVARPERVELPTFADPTSGVGNVCGLGTMYGVGQRRATRVEPMAALRNE
jgi:hypothetical protein